MIYPYTPFIAEEIYLNLPGHKESIMLDSYPEVNEKYIFDKESLEVLDLIHMIKDVRAYKVENNLAPNAQVELNIVPLYKDFDSSLFITYLKRFAFAKEVCIVSTIEGNIKVYPSCQMEIKDNIDKSVLLEKIEKEIERLNSEIARGEKMLSNPGFVQKAPQAKIDLEKAKLEQNKKDLEVYLEKRAKIA